MVKDIEGYHIFSLGAQNPEETPHVDHCPPLHGILWPRSDPRDVDDVSMVCADRDSSIGPPISVDSCLGSPPDLPPSPSSSSSSVPPLVVSDLPRWWKFASFPQMRYSGILAIASRSFLSEEAKRKLCDERDREGETEREQPPAALRRRAYSETMLTTAMSATGKAKVLGCRVSTGVRATVPAKGLRRHPALNDKNRGRSEVASLPLCQAIAPRSAQLIRDFLGEMSQTLRWTSLPLRLRGGRRVPGSGWSRAFACVSSRLWRVDEKKTLGSEGQQSFSRQWTRPKKLEKPRKNLTRRRKLN